MLVGSKALENRTSKYTYVSINREYGNLVINGIRSPFICFFGNGRCNTSNSRKQNECEPLFGITTFWNGIKSFPMKTSWKLLLDKITASRCGAGAVWNRKRACFTDEQQQRQQLRRCSLQVCRSNAPFET